MTNPHIIVAGTRRSWSPEQKRAILAEADDSATTASAVARRHGLHSSLLFRWRRAVLAEQHARTPSAPPTFVPLALPPPAVAAAERPAGSGVVEIELAGGHRPRAEAGADLTLLQDVIAALLHRWAGGYAIMMHGPEGAVWQAAVNGVALITIALSIVTVVDLTLAAFRLTPLQGNHASWRLAIRHCGKSAIGALSAQLFESAQRNLLAQKAFLIGQAQEPS